MQRASGSTRTIWSGTTERMPVKGEQAMAYARFEDVPAWQEAVCFQISNLKSIAESFSRQLRGLPAELGDQGPAPSERSIATEIRCGENGGGIPARIIGTAAAGPSAAETIAATVTGSVTAV